VTGFRRGASVLLGGQGLGGLVWLQFDSYWPAKSQAQMARTPFSYCPHGGTITSLLTDEQTTLACEHFLALLFAAQLQLFQLINTHGPLARQSFRFGVRRRESTKLGPRIGCCLASAMFSLIMRVMFGV
jgi:hypothetical protein